MEGVDIETRLKSALERTTGSHGIRHETLLADLSHSAASLSRYASALEATFGIEHPFALLHGCLTVGDLITALRGVMCVSEGQAPVMTHEARITPILFPANRYSYFLKREQQLQAWSVCSPLWMLDGPLDRSALEHAVLELLERHEGLRLQGGMTPLGWAEAIRSTFDGAPISWIESDPLDEAQVQSAVDILLEKVITTLDFSGPLIHVLAGEMKSEQRGFLCVMAHHLVVDDFSFRLVIDELLDLYQARRAKRSLKLLPVLISLSEYSARSIAYWNARAEQQLGWWQRQPWELTSTLFPETPGDLTNRQERFASCSVSSILVENKGHFFISLSQRGMTPAQLALTAAGHALCDWFDVPSVNLGLVTHGRESVSGADTRRTVGWLSEVVPVILPASERGTSAINARHTLLDTLRTGKSHGVLREICPDVSVRNRMCKLPLPQVSLNIKLQPNMDRTASAVEKIDRVFNTARFTQGATRVYPMSGGVYFNENTLYFSWDYSLGLMSRESGNELSALFARWFRLLASKWGGFELPVETTRYHPSSAFR